MKTVLGFLWFLVCEVLWWLFFPITWPASIIIGLIRLRRLTKEKERLEREESDLAKLQIELQ